MNNCLSTACSLSTIICLFTTALADSAQKEAPESSNQPTEVNKLRTVINWLPADTQTLMAVNGPIKLRNAADGNVPKGNERLLGMFREIVMMPMHGLSSEQSKKLKGATVTRALFGSRRFRAPHDIGVGSYEGCLILEFDADSVRVVNDMFENLLDNAPEPDLLFGHRLAIIRKGIETAYVARPKKNLLLFATDREFLKDVLHRMNSPESKVAFPDHLAEWKYVDHKAAFWAIRHFDKSDIKDDYSSPLNPQRGRQGEGDPGAIGLAFDYQPDNKTAVIVHYMSEGESKESFLARQWVMPESEAKAIAVTPTVRSSGSFVYKVKHNLHNEEQTSYFILQFYQAFGFIILI